MKTTNIEAKQQEKLKQPQLKILYQESQENHNFEKQLLKQQAEKKKEIFDLKRKVAGQIEELNVKCNQIKSELKEIHQKLQQCQLNKTKVENINSKTEKAQDSMIGTNAVSEQSVTTKKMVCTDQTKEQNEQIVILQEVSENNTTTNLNNQSQQQNPPQAIPSSKLKRELSENDQTNNPNNQFRQQQPSQVIRCEQRQNSPTSSQSNLENSININSLESSNKNNSSNEQHLKKGRIQMVKSLQPINQESQSYIKEEDIEKSSTNSNFDIQKKQPNQQQAQIFQNNRLNNQEFPPCLIHHNFISHHQESYQIILSSLLEKIIQQRGKLSLKCFCGSQIKRDDIKTPQNKIYLECILQTQVSQIFTNYGEKNYLLKCSNNQCKFTCFQNQKYSKHGGRYFCSMCGEYTVDILVM